MKNYCQEYSSIIFLKSSSNYTTIHYLDGTRRMECSTLKKMEDSLIDKGFFRSHHSYLINEQYVVGISKLGFLLQSGILIPISRKLSRKEIKKRFFSSISSC
jgi:two-component system, LytTR family, response regulator